MRARKLYRHPHCLDVDLYIVAIYNDGRFLVRYWNRHWRAFHDELDTVTITDTATWRLVE